MRGKKKLKHTITRPVSSESEISSESENVYTSTPARQDPPPLSSKLSQIKTKNSSGSAAVKGQPSTKSLVEENSPAKGRPRKNPPKKRKVSPLKDIQPSHSGPSTSRQADEAEKRHYSRSRRDSLSPPSRHSPPVSGPRSRSHSPVSVPSRSGRTPTQASTRGHQSSASNPPGRQGMHHPVATAVAGRHRSIGPPRRRRAPGEKALQEIRHYQKSVGLLMAKMPFARLVREILQEMHSSSFYWQASAIEALQESSEIYLVRLFEDSVCCTIHANRKTLMVRDMQLTRRLRISCGLF